MRFESLAAVTSLFILTHITVTEAFSLSYCVVPPAVHIRSNESCFTPSINQYASTNIDWAGMKGEYENTQILLTTNSSSAVNISFTISSLVNSTLSYDIPSSMLTVFQVGHVNCSETTRYPGSGGGWRPDPLFELTDDMYGTNIVMVSNYSQTLWVTVQIPC